jgi:hypothetical protein
MAYINREEAEAINNAMKHLSKIATKHSEEKEIRKTISELYSLKCKAKNQN